MIELLTIGILLGLSAGCAPGPLLTLVISESLRHGVGSGVKVALAPIISDLPIILLSLSIVSTFSGFRSGLGIISLVGGIFILHAGYTCMRAGPVEEPALTGPSRSLLKGVMVNFLNPHPYLFWLSVGAPVMNKALATGIRALAAFLCGFYLTLVGSKILLAIAVGRSRSFLSGRAYRSILCFLGVLLAVFALLLLRDGARLLGLI